MSEGKKPKWTAEDLREFAEFRALATALEFNDRELAEYLGVQPSTISQIRSQGIRAEGQWRSLMTKVAVNSPERMRVAFGLLREDGQLREEAKPALEAWERELLEKCRVLSAEDRAKLLALLEMCRPVKTEYQLGKG